MKKLNKIELHALLTIKEELINKIQDNSDNNKIILMDNLKLNTINKVLKLWK